MAVPTWFCPVCERHYRLSQPRCTKCGTPKPEGEWEEGVRVAEAAPRVQAPVEAPPEAPPEAPSEPVQEAGALPTSEKTPFWAHIPCPDCDQTNALQKLSVAFAEDALTSAESSRDAELAPPIKPEYKGPIERVVALVQPIVEGTFEHVGPLTGLLVLFVTLATPMIIWAWFTAWLSMMLTGNTFDMDAPIPRPAALLWLFLVIVPPVFFFYGKWRRERAFREEHLPPWLTAVEEWSKRFRCKRCSVTFTMDVPPPLDIAPVEGDEEPEVEAGEGAVPAKTPALFMGAAQSGRCAACDKEMSGIRLSYNDYQGIATPVREAPPRGYVCPGCSSFFCLPCAAAALSTDSSSDLKDAVCSGCQSPMSTPDYVVDTTDWYDGILLVESEG